MAFLADTTTLRVSAGFCGNAQTKDDLVGAALAQVGDSQTPQWLGYCVLHKKGSHHGFMAPQARAWGLVEPGSRLRS